MRKEILQKVLLILFLLLFIISIAYAKVPDIVLNQKNAVVTIYVSDKEGKQITTGTGFLIDKNGIIATNYHVISKWLEALDNTLFIKMENGAYFPIEELLTFDEDNDLALFNVEGKELPTVKLASDYKPKQGEDVVVIGSPFGLETTVSDGIISSVRGKGELVQITAPVSQGSSGSPVFNSKGEVIGVATFLITGGQNLNFAIPVKHIANLLKESKKPKKKVMPAPVPDAPAPATAPVTIPETLNDLEKAKGEVRKNPDSSAAHFNLGRSYGKLGMYREAVEAYKQAIRIKPLASHYFWLALAYDKLGMHREATDAYKQAIKIAPDSAENHYNLGVNYYKLGMYKEAIEAYKQAIKIAPDFVEAHYNLGISYLILNDRGSAVDKYKILKTLDSERANKLFNLIYK